MKKNKIYEIKLKLTAPRKIKNDCKNFEKTGFVDMFWFF